MTHKNIFKLALLLAFAITTVWYTAGATYSHQRPISEPDALVYLQYARNMAEGHPFEYVQGDAPTTGCTSYLYPILLTILYKLGCTGQRLLTAGFFLNGFFYLASVLLTGLIARKLAPRFYPFALFAMVLSGQSIYTFLGQTDMGLLMTLLLFCFWAFLFKRKIWLLIGTILAGLTHPSAAALAGGLIVAGFLSAVLSREPFRKKLAFKTTWPFWIGCAGVAAIASTLVFNYLLTGDFQFMSLRSKGLFKTYSVLGALNISLMHLVHIVKGFFFSFDTTNYRAFFFFPLITGLIAMGGLLLRPWNEPKKVRFEIFVLLVISAELILLSTNNQQGVSHDRYMAWITPLLYIYIAVFLEHLRNRFELKQAASALATALLLFQFIPLVLFSSTFLMACNRNAIGAQFARETLNETQPGDTLVFEGGAGQMWHFENRKILNPFGLFTAECAKGRHWLCYVETLKYHPELHAPYWVVSKAEHASDPAYKFFLGDLIMSNTDALTQKPVYALYKADWSALKRSPPNVSKAWKCKDRLDVGYYKDEERCRYRTKTRLRAVKIIPSVAKNETTGLVDVGQLVLGHETFQIKNITPNQPLHIILRTARKTRSLISQYQSVTPLDHTFSSPMNLTVCVDEQPIDVSFEIKEEGFSDASFTIPAEYIQSETPNITVLGDHLTYGYWFYQACE